MGKKKGLFYRRKLAGLSWCPAQHGLLILGGVEAAGQVSGKVGVGVGRWGTEMEN